jgi:hypothetical protein
MSACLISLTHIAVTRYYTVYAVHHTFKRGKADTFWEDMADADLPAMAKLQHQMGIFNHYFLPAGPAGPMLCLWECKDTEMGSVEFKAFIDGPDSPASDLINKVYPVNAAAAAPASAWPKMPKAPAPTTGSFFCASAGPGLSSLPLPLHLPLLSLSLTSKSPD